MKDSLAAAVNIKAAGLDDMMLKRLLLANYRSNLLSDTDILIEISPEEMKELGATVTISYEIGEGAKSSEYTDDNIKPFSVIGGIKDKGRGEDGHFYLKTKGAVTVEYEGEKLIFYPQEALDEMTDYYYTALDNNSDNFASTLKDYLDKCYTYAAIGGVMDQQTGEMTAQTPGILKYVVMEDKTIETWLYENQGSKRKVSTQTDGGLGKVQVTINDKVAQYGTPMEFMIHMLEITGSQDFINAFIKECVDKTNIKAELYKTDYKETITETKTRDRESVVKGKKENIEYVVDYYTTDNIVVKEVPAGKERVNIEVENKDKNDVEIILIKDFKDREIVELNSSNNWKYTWKDLEKPSQEIKEKKDKSKVIEVKETTHTEENFSLEVYEVETWYQKITIPISEYTTEHLETINAKGEYRNIDNASDADKLKLKDENKKYTLNQNPNVFKIDGDVIMEADPNYPDSLSNMKKYSEEMCLSSQFTHIIIQPETDYNYEEYIFDEMVSKDTNVTKQIIKKTSIGRVTAGLGTVEDRSNIFLSLLSNADGKYKSGATFVSKKAGGKVVQYEDIYKGKVGAGEMLENGAGILFTLLESEYSSCKGLSEVMRYLLYLYSGGEINYGVTDFNHAVMNINLYHDVENTVVTGANIQEKVWRTLKSLGYSDIAVAAAMGNIHYESSTLDPTKVEDGYNEFNGGIGICQWTNTSRGKDGRNTQLRAYAKSKGKTWKDEDIQIEFLVAELGGGGDAKKYASIQLIDSSYTGTTYRKSDWENAADTEPLNETKLKELTTLFCFTFERPDHKNPSVIASLDKRFKYAKQYYNKYHNSIVVGGTEVITPTNPTPTNPNGGGTEKRIFDGSNFDGTPIFTEFTSNITGRTFLVFNQEDKTKINLQGLCNRACAATIASGYRKKGDGRYSTVEAVKRGGDDILSNANSTTNYFKPYGLKAEIDKYSYSINNIRKFLLEGKYISLWYKSPGTTLYGKSKGKNGEKHHVCRAGSKHWINIIGYDNKDGKEMIYITNPGRGYSCGWFPIDELDDLKSYNKHFTVISEK